MDSNLTIGSLNGHAVGRILKETVRRAVATIRANRFAFEVTAKEGYTGQMDDMYTSADRAAQEVYVRALTECFPDCGIVAEEELLSIAPKNGCTAYFTVDPLDGTKAYVRRQSHGIGTMVALVDKSVVLSAYIGDVNTNETYGYRPGSNRVHRISDLDTAQELTFHSPLGEKNGYILLRDPLDFYTYASKQMVRKYFINHLVDGGSIGIWMARLWKREVAALLLPPSKAETPWDSTPVVGICQKLGYRFFRPKHGELRRAEWTAYEPLVIPELYKRQHDTLIVHKSDCATLGLISKF